MKTNYLNRFAVVATLTIMLSACGKDDNVIPDIPPSDGTTMTLEGKVGEDASANLVYVDLSTEQQTGIARNSWTLGFSNASDFKVILNNHYSVTALETTFDNLAEVNGDAVNIDDLAIGINYQTGSIIGSFALIDDTAGTYSSTVIKPVAATAAENKVYLVNAVGGPTVDAENVFKIKVNRSSNGYTLEYAKLNETTSKTIEIAKDAEYDFRYVSLQGGNIVNNEPKKADWDLLWGYNLYFTSMGGPALPYPMADFVQINSGSGVRVAQILIEDVTYNDFSEANLSSITWSSSKNYIGANWRSVGMTSSGVKTDRYYLIQDTAGNIYKLKFNSMGTADSGERGRPEIEFKLVKRG